MLKGFKKYFSSKESQGIILIYHRILKPATDPQLLCVSPGNFAEQLKYLNDNFNVMSLDDMVAGVKEKKLPEKAVAITFDDGYVDNLEFAKPVLVKHNVPATVFVSTGYTGKNCEFWWDELEVLLLTNSSLPHALKLKIGGKDFEWKTGKPLIQGSPQWTVLDAENPTPNHFIYRELHKLLKPISYSERESLLESIAAQSGIKRQCREHYRPMTESEIMQLAEGGLVSIGAHTVTHPALSGLTKAEQQTEIMKSKLALERILGKNVDGFSYPYGSLNAFNKDSVEVVNALKFNYACANFQGKVANETNVFKLPRCLVRDWPAEEFAHHMKEFTL